jgi:hypothetical protein
MVWSTQVRYPIDEQLAELAFAPGGRLPRRADFEDPLLATFQAVPLSQVIDQELDRFYNEPVAETMISRVFRRFRPSR